ncbi:MAG: glycoside hydrolase family 31 protein, partial [Bacilli bacterium]|nr:glycoside hydrolase family 31 protein [Bacilli bacterium]
LDTNSNINRLNTFILNHYHFYDMKRNYKRRPMILSNNAGVAAHRYPVLYSGKTLVDWKTLKQTPFFNSSASNIGVSWWSHDIGGYYKGIEDNELYIRFVQLGVFSPILKFGSDKGKYYKREPWRWSIKTYAIVKDYLKLRHRLIPYLYSEAYKYHKEGIPLIEPIYYRYKEMYDDVLYRNQYYFGNGFFISPIITKKNYIMNRVIHNFYIPDGVWYDFVTGKKFPGGRSYVSFFRDQDYPVFVKAGSIIPLSNDDNLFDTTPPTNLEIQVFPGRSNLYQLYEDDGMSDLYNKGFYIKTNIDYNYLPNNYTVIVRALEGKSGIIPKYRNYKIVFRNTKQADEVITYVNDQEIKNKHYTSGPDFIVEVNNVSTIAQLTVNCKGKDIEIDAVRLINDDIEGIISDLTIETEMKEKIDAVIFSDLPMKKKRIAVRRLRNKGLKPKFIRLFLKLLEYIEQV